MPRPRPVGDPRRVDPPRAALPPLRVLHVAAYAPGAWAYGGIPRVTAALTDALARAGHDVTLCTTDVCDAANRLRARLSPGLASLEPSGPADGGTRLVVFPNLSNRLAYQWQLFTPIGLRGFLRRHAGSFDIGHLHACRNLPVTIAARALTRAGVPYVVAPNGTAPRVERRLLAKRVFDLVASRGFLERAAGVVAVSQAEERQLLALRVPPSRIHRIPNPIDLEEFTPLPSRGLLRARLQFDGAPVVLFLGQLSPRKRVDLLVQAFGQLDHPTARLVIAGNDMGALAAIRRMTTALRLESRTRFIGLLRGRERLEALADADVVVYPSEHEVFGLVPLEALLVGTPVIVADDSGCGEIVREVGGGQVVRAGDVAALARALRAMLYEREGWKRTAEEAAPRVRAAYDGRAVGAALADLYRSLIAP